MKTSIFQLIDYDRTMFDTSRFIREVTARVNRFREGMGDAIDARFEQTYKSEQTFFIMQFIRDELGAEVLDELVQEVLADNPGDRFLLPGVEQRLDVAAQLSTIQPSWGILTYGHEVDQLLKLKIGGFSDAPVFISDTPDKSELIRSWLQPDGSFALPAEFGGATAEKLSFEDDKIRAFHNLPDNVFGVWITSFDDAQERIHEAGLGGKLVPAVGLVESTEYLNSVLK